MPEPHINVSSHLKHQQTMLSLAKRKWLPYNNKKFFLCSLYFPLKLRPLKTSRVLEIRGKNANVADWSAWWGGGGLGMADCGDGARGRGMVSAHLVLNELWRNSG